MISGTYEIHAVLTDSNLKGPPLPRHGRHAFGGDAAGLDTCRREAGLKACHPGWVPVETPRPRELRRRGSHRAARLSRVTRPSRKLLLPRPPDGLSPCPGEVFSSTRSLQRVRPSCLQPDLCSAARRAQEEALSRIRQERLECSDQSLQELFKDRLPSDPVVQKPTVGLRRGNGGSSSQRIQSTPVSPLALRDHSGRSDAIRSGGKTLPARGTPQR